MRFEHIFQCFASHDSSATQRRMKDVFCNGSKKRFLQSSKRKENEKKKYYLQNGEELLKERISLFNGRTNPILCFSVDELNSITVDRSTRYGDMYKGVYEGRLVLLKLFNFTVGERAREEACREIAVATQMSTHNNVHKLIGCCLETECPAVVFDWVNPGATLHDRIHRSNSSDMKPLEWKDKLRIAWEISHAVSYLHTAFRRSIIHRDLKPEKVFLDEDNVAKLTDFSLCISIPEGEEFVEDQVIGTYGYASPEYTSTGKTALSSDVYSFGILLLVLLTGRQAHSENLMIHEWVGEQLRDETLREIVDPSIICDGSTSDEYFDQQLKSCISLALECTGTEADSRPTMVEIATKLKHLIKSSQSIPSSNAH